VVRVLKEGGKKKKKEKKEKKEKKKRKKNVPIVHRLEFDGVVLLLRGIFLSADPCYFAIA